jgi:hypothetical protein
MDDGLKLYTPTQVREFAPAAHADALRTIAEHGGDVEHAASVEVLARLMLLLRAREVRCTRGCDHSPRIAILDRGVDCCMRCRFQFADAKARGDGRCDTCNADGEELQGIRSRLLGGMVLPTGDVQAAVELVARVCPDCLELVEAAAGSSTAASWN